MSVDMSPRAITTRLIRMSQLRALCLSLAVAGRALPRPPQPQAVSPADRP